MASTAFLNLSLVSFFAHTCLFFLLSLPSTNSIFLFFSLLSAYFFFRSGGIWVILDVNFGQYHIISSVLQVQHELSWCINSLGVLGALGAVPRAKLGSWARLVTSNKYWTFFGLGEAVKHLNFERASPDEDHWLGGHEKVLRYSGSWGRIYRLHEADRRWRSCFLGGKWITWLKVCFFFPSTL